MRNINRTWSTWKTFPGWLRWFAGLAAVAALLVIVVPLLFEDYVRDRIEHRANKLLEGYSVQIDEVDIRPARLGITIRELTVNQRNPDQPVAKMAAIRARIGWTHLLKGRLVTHIELDEPLLRVSPALLQDVMDDDDAPVDEFEWDEVKSALRHLGRIQVNDGQLLLIDPDLDEPLDVHTIQFRIENVGREADGSDGLSSPFHLEAGIFREGQLEMEGRAGLEPGFEPLIKAAFRISNVRLDAARNILERANLDISGGLLDGNGEFEFGIRPGRLHFDELVLRDMEIDYVHTDYNDEGPDEEDAAEAAEDLIDGAHPGATGLSINRLSVHGNFGFINRDEDPQYRLFLDDATATLTNYSVDFVDGPAETHLEGLFMGNGALMAKGTFRPEEAGPDFDLKLEIRDTFLPTMNDLLQAYGNFDVQDGWFSFFSEISIQDGYVEGYLRPLFRDMEVFDAGDDDKGLLEQAYEAVVGAISGILENIPRDEVATHAEFSGSLDDPDMSTWQVLTGLVRNAFFHAILPGFESELENR